MAVSKKQPVHETPEPFIEIEPRSIFESIKLMFSSAADVMIYTTGAVGTSAKAVDSLANAGLLMAQSNERLVTIRVAGKEESEMAKLVEKYPNLAM